MVKNEKEGILLESGTNEIEVMKFTVMGEFYGINVAKVQEIIMSEKVKPMPHANPAVEGIFKWIGILSFKLYRKHDVQKCSQTGDWIIKGYPDTGTQSIGYDPSFPS